VCIDSLQIYDPLFELSLRHLAIACAQAVFMALSGDPFYAVIIPVHRMTVKRRDIGDFDQELPGTSLLFRHTQSLMVKLTDLDRLGEDHAAHADGQISLGLISREQEGLPFLSS